MVMKQDVINKMIQHETVEGLRSERIRELFLIRPGELPMKTETPPNKVDPFTLMEVVEYALSEKSEEERITLSAYYRLRHDIRMISKSRKGRLEIEKILTILQKEEADGGITL